MNYPRIRTAVKMDGWWKWTLAAGATGVTILVVRRVFSGGIVCKSKVLIKDKTVIITGANSGIGKATAVELAKRGARLILACRDVSKAEKAVKDIHRAVPDAEIVVKPLDLASIDSVTRFANGIIMDEAKVDVLINNAGIYQCPFMNTEDGFEMQMGVNHLGHFHLTNLLLDKLKASSARIVVVSSALHRLGKIDFDDMIVPNGVTYSKKKAYNDSKLANCLFARELSKKLQSSSVTVTCLHPGMVRTNLARHAIAEIPFIMKLFFYPFYWCLTKSPYYGCQTVVYCAVAEEVVSGSYYGNCKEEPWSEVASDDDAATRLWDLSARLTGLNKKQS